MNKELLSEARKHIAGFIKAKRKALGLTQEELAGLAGVSSRTISKIETKVFVPNTELLILLLHHLKQDLAFVDRETGDKMILQIK